MTRFKTALFYLLSFTWGIVMTLIGSIVMLALLVSGHEIKKFNDRYYAEIGQDWGGVSLGCFFLVNKFSSLYLKQHESGHGVQNIIFGPLMPFVVCIPSVIRYWIMEIDGYRTKWFFVSVVAAVGSAVSAALLSVGIIYSMLACTIVGALLGGYMITLLVWLLLFELPKYKNGNPDYYSIWFEKGASDLGKKYCPENT